MLESVFILRIDTIWANNEIWWKTEKVTFWLPYLISSQLVQDTIRLTFTFILTARYYIWNDSLVSSQEPPIREFRNECKGNIYSYLRNSLDFLKLKQCRFFCLTLLQGFCWKKSENSMSTYTCFLFYTARLQAIVIFFHLSCKTALPKLSWMQGLYIGDQIQSN